MKKFLISSFIGLIAGIIDVIPMIIQGLNWYANISAFVHWIVLGIIIAHIEIRLKYWLKGLIIAELSTFPIVILVLQKGTFSVIPILIMTAILGSLVGYAGEKYAN